MSVEAKKLKPSLQRVLDALRRAGKGGLTTHALCQPDVGGIRFGGRLFELRQLGFEIEKRHLHRPHVTNAGFIYILRGEPAGVGGGGHGSTGDAAPSDSSGNTPTEVSVAGSDQGDGGGDPGGNPNPPAEPTPDSDPGVVPDADTPPGDAGALFPADEFKPKPGHDEELEAA